MPLNFVPSFILLILVYYFHSMLSWNIFNFNINKDQSSSLESLKQLFYPDTVWILKPTLWLESKQFSRHSQTCKLLYLFINLSLTQTPRFLE